MENLEKFLLESFGVKGVQHHLENQTKIKQYIDNILLAASGQSLEESSKTLYTGLSSVRDLLSNEISSAFFASQLSEKINQYHTLVEEEARQAKVEAQDLEVLDNQDQKKT